MNNQTYINTFKAIKTNYFRIKRYLETTRGLIKYPLTPMKPYPSAAQSDFSYKSSISHHISAICI